MLDEMGTRFVLLAIVSVFVMPEWPGCQLEPILDISRLYEHWHEISRLPVHAEMLCRGNCHQEQQGRMPLVHYEQLRRLIRVKYVGTRRWDNVNQVERVAHGMSRPLDPCRNGLNHSRLYIRLLFGHSKFISNRLRKLLNACPNLVFLYRSKRHAKMNP